MRKTLLASLLALMLFLSFTVGGGVQPAHAASITFIQFNRKGCGNNATGFRWTTDFAAPMTVRTIVSVGSSVYMDQIFTINAAPPYNWGLFSDNTGGTVNAVYPTPPNAPINVSLSIQGGPSYSFIYVCDGFFAGRGIPDGFVLKTITCTTPAYQNPGGQLVPTGETVLAGQTWYVNPTPITAVNGKGSWTEIFLSGSENAYIPTKCVG